MPALGHSRPRLRILREPIKNENRPRCLSLSASVATTRDIMGLFLHARSLGIHHSFARATGACPPVRLMAANLSTADAYFFASACFHGFLTSAPIAHASRASLHNAVRSHTRPASGSAPAPHDSTSDSRIQRVRPRTFSGPANGTWLAISPTPARGSAVTIDPSRSLLWSVP